MRNPLISAILFLALAGLTTATWAETYTEAQIDSVLATKSTRTAVFDSLSIKFLSDNPINLNTAPADSLTMLPGIGLKTAERIIEWRNENNGFESTLEILYVKGIGKAKFVKIADFITAK